MYISFKKAIIEKSRNTNFNCTELTKKEEIKTMMPTRKALDKLIVKVVFTVSSIWPYLLFALRIGIWRKRELAVPNWGNLEKSVINDKPFQMP